jgi:hypothetical protein
LKFFEVFLKFLKFLKFLEVFLSFFKFFLSHFYARMISSQIKVQAFSIMESFLAEVSIKFMRKDLTSLFPASKIICSLKA